MDFRFDSCLHRSLSSARGAPPILCFARRHGLRATPAVARRGLLSRVSMGPRSPPSQGQVCRLAIRPLCSRVHLCLS